MAEQREMTNFRLHDVRLTRVRDLFTAPTKYKGQPIPEENQRFIITAIIPKTQASYNYNGAGGRLWGWLAEPAMQPLTDALGKVYHQYYNGYALEQLSSIVKDGDLPNSNNKIVEHMKGHWYFTASCHTRFPPNIEGIVDGQAIPVPAQSMGGRKLWDDGDYASLDLSISKSGQKNGEFVLYVNSVLFLRPGERIASMGNRASGEEMMKEAAAKGYQVSGLNGGALPPAGGFPPNGGHGAPFQPASGPQGQFAPPPQGGSGTAPFAPSAPNFQAAAAPTAAPAPFGNPPVPGGSAISPSSPAPGGFPASPFPPR